MLKVRNTSLKTYRTTSCLKNTTGNKDNAFTIKKLIIAICYYFKNLRYDVYDSKKCAFN